MRVAASELTAAWPSGRPGEEVGGLLAVVGPPCPGRTARGPRARTAPWSTGPCPWIPVPADQPRVWGARVGAGSTSQPNGDRLAGWYLETVGGHVVQIRCSQKIRPRVV